MYLIDIIYNEIEPLGRAMGPPGRQWTAGPAMEPPGLALLYKSYKLYIYIYPYIIYIIYIYIHIYKKKPDPIIT